MSERHRLTVFGQALFDLFAALILFFLVLGYNYTILYVYARGIDLSSCRVHHGDLDEVACLNAIRASAMPGWLTIVNRAAVAASGVLVIGTAIGTGWQMSRGRSGPRMAVHVPAYSRPHQGPGR